MKKNEKNVFRRFHVEKLFEITSMSQQKIYQQQQQKH